MNYISLRISLVLGVIISLLYVDIKAQTRAKASELTENQISWYDKGFDFYIGSGIYFANKNNAKYYNGSPENEHNLNYVFKNKYQYDEIFALMQENHPYITDSVFVASLPIEDMRYSITAIMTLGAKYKIDKNWGININYTFVQLKASGFFTMDYPGPLTNTQIERPFLQNLMAIEQRSFIELGVSYLFHFHKIIKPFIEFGAQFNFINIKKFQAIIEEKAFYDLLDYYNGVNYVPGAQMQKYNTKFGGAGYGLFLNAGLKIVFNKYISLDPLLYVSVSSICQKGYKEMNFNYGVMARIVISDLIFSKVVK